MLEIVTVPPRNLHRPRRLCAPLVLAVVLSAACGQNSEDFDHYALYRSLSLARTIEVVLPNGVDEIELRSVARKFAASGTRALEFTHAGDARSSRSIPRVVIADGSTPGLARVLECLDLQCGQGGSFSFQDQTYTGLDDVLVATFADPERDSLPMTLYFGVDATHALRFVRDLTPAWRPAFRCWRDGHIEREGRFAGANSVRLSGATAQLQSLARLRVEHASDPGIDLVLHGALDPSQVSAYRSTLRSVRSELIELLAPRDAHGTPTEVVTLPRLQVHLWPDAQSLALVSGTWELSTVGPPANRIDVALTPRNDSGFAAARAIALALAGAPADDWLLDGVGMHVARAWWGRNQVDWIPFLFTGGNVPDVATLVAQRTRVSPHIVTPLRGALFDCWLALHGREALQDAWRGVSRLELPSQGELNASVERAHPELELFRRERERGVDPARTRSLPNTAFRRGVQLVQPIDVDGRGFKGYGTPSCRDSVRDAMEAGANSFGLTAYAFADDGLAPWAGTRRSEPFATTTPDVALAAAAAHAGNVRVMITPQLLTSRAGSWSGWSMNESREAWEEFFAEWKACVVHYALLAELCDAETLCLGSELASATRSHYDDTEMPWVPEYALSSGERWREVIAAARSCFRGALTYAANNEGEARQLDFWDELDFVSVDVFPSLDDADLNATRPTDAQAIARLRGALHALAELAREHGKPALVTEIGFAPTTENWRAPRSALGDVDLDSQRRMYACMAEAIGLQNATHAPLAGVFVWCWSTDPSAGNAPDRSFTPQNRPAVDWLARVYGRQ